MHISQAISLLQNELFETLPKSNWADLGCGTGTFTNALAHLLKDGSKIVAVDVRAAALNNIEVNNRITIEKLKADFVRDELPLTNLDGILMANSLHFVKDKVAFINKAEKYIKDDGCFLLVEYDMDTTNQWVPYPLSFTSLNKLFKDCGYTSVAKLNEIPSVYNRANIYSALIRK